MSIKAFRGGTEVIAAATVATITHDRGIPAGAIKKFSIVTTGANNSLDVAVVRERVKSGGTEFVNVPSAHLRALIEALAPANTIPPAARLRFTIPCNLPFSLGRVGLPAGILPTVEYDVDVNSSVGTSSIGWEEFVVGENPEWMPRFYSFASGIAASTNPGRIELSDPALIYGIGVPIVGATGVTNLRVVLSGVEVINLEQSHLLEQEFLTNPQSVTTTIFIRMPVLLPAIPKQSFIEVVTGAGAAATNVYSVLSLTRLAA